MQTPTDRNPPPAEERYLGWPEFLRREQTGFRLLTKKDYYCYNRTRVDLGVRIEYMRSLLRCEVERKPCQGQVKTGAESSPRGSFTFRSSDSGGHAERRRRGGDIITLTCGRTSWFTPLKSPTAASPRAVVPPASLSAVVVWFVSREWPS